MCGRFSQTRISAYETLRGLPPDFFVPREHIHPDYAKGEAVFLRASENGALIWDKGRFWLIPRFWNAPLAKLPTSFNARLEGIETKPFYRDLLATNRCVVPVNAWYETKKRKERFRFSHANEEVVGLAGLFDTWQSPAGETVTSFSVITVSPSEVVRDIHDRMPAVLSREDVAPWMHPETPVGEALSLLGPCEELLVVPEEKAPPKQLGLF